MTDRPTIVLADDHPATRDALREVLEDDGWEIRGIVGDAAAAVAATRRLRPDVCLLDVNMPGGGPAACERITREVPGTAVVMLTVSASADDLFEALRVGARGYLLKDIDPDQLGPTLRAVLAGETMMPRAVTARIVDEFRARQGMSARRLFRRHAGSLSPDEWQVLELLRAGRSTEEVAVELDLPLDVTRAHVQSILGKLREGD